MPVHSEKKSNFSGHKLSTSAKKNDFDVYYLVNQPNNLSRKKMTSDVWTKPGVIIQ